MLVLVLMAPIAIRLFQKILHQQIAPQATQYYLVMGAQNLLVGFTRLGVKDHAQ